jgi:DNA-binding response OmpR family regulator
MIRILLIEDEDAIREAEAAYLRNAAAGASVLQQFEVVTPHAIVLDLSLPSIYGLAYVPHDTSRVRKPP